MAWLDLICEMGMALMNSNDMFILWIMITFIWMCGVKLVNVIMVYVGYMDVWYGTCDCICG